MEENPTDSTEINWPEHYAPGNAPVHVRNTLEINSPAERVWAWLVRAELWPDWYPNASKVRIADNAGPDLGLGREFHWRTFGVGIRSCVKEFEPCRRIAWDGHSFGIDVYHAWLIQGRGDSCLVVTEETQHGFIAQLGARLMPKRMSTQHQIWLEQLAKKSAAGPPPSE